MAKARRPGKKQQDERSGPSLFFIIALIIGFVILVWWFMHFMPERSTGEEPGKNARTMVRSIAGPAAGASYLA